MGQYDSDSSGNGTRFKGRTGIFSLDFPPSPKVPKGKGKKSTSDVDVCEGTSGGDQITCHSQSSNGMGIDKKWHHSVTVLFDNFSSWIISECVKPCDHK